MAGSSLSNGKDYHLGQWDSFSNAVGMRKKIEDMLCQKEKNVLKECNLEGMTVAG